MAWRRLAVNLVLGLGLFFLLRLPIVQQNRTVESIRDPIIAWQMDRLTGLGASDSLAFIDVSEAVRREWRMGSTTRRDKLQSLIAWAKSGEPAAVIVDFDLSERRSAREDADLATYLGGLQRCRNACIPVLLVRTTQASSRYQYAGRDQPALEARGSFLDKVLGTSARQSAYAGNVLWGTTGMDRDADGVERRWRLWETSCPANGGVRAFRGVLIPSVMLLSAAIKTRTPLSSVDMALSPHTLTCVLHGASAPANADAPSETTLRLGKSTFELTEDYLKRRLFFRLPWAPGSERADGLAVILRADQVAQYRPVILQGRIVVIGSSSEILEDPRQTPIGTMPGALVVLNGINALLTGKEFREPLLPVDLSIEVIQILIVSTLFRDLSRWRAFAASLGMVVGGGLTFGFVLFNSAVWVDSVVPIFAVCVNELIESGRHGVARMLRRA